MVLQLFQEAAWSATCWSLSTSKIMLMCISGGLEGLKTERVEKGVGFKNENDAPAPSKKPSDRLLVGHFRRRK